MQQEITSGRCLPGVTKWRPPSRVKLMLENVLGMVKPNEVGTCSGMLFNLKKWSSDTCYNMDEP